MATFTRAFILLGFVVGLLLGTAPMAQEKSTKPMEMLMGGNFQIVARVLSDLVDGRYESIPAQADLMVRHADLLASSPPTDLQGAAQRAVFIAYATNLKLAATQLLAVSSRLARHDPQRSGPGELNLDYLQSSAAQHFGNVVTACAQCHIQLRHKLL